MIVKSALKYIRREGTINTFRRFLIYFILEWYASFFTPRYSKKEPVIVKEIQGSKMYLDMRDKGVSRELALRGIREELFTKTLRGALREGDCVLDVGANIGYYALMAACLVGPQGKVYAIEPVSHNIKLLEDSIRLNNYSNIETFNLAMGQSESVSKLYLSDHPNWSSFYRPRQVTGQIDIQITSIDSFLKDKRSPDVIRMDVEGYEYEILLGMSDLLESGRPLRLFIEFHPDIIERQRAAAFLSTLRKYEFQLKKVILEPNIYPPHSGFLWRLVDFLNEKILKLRFGAWEMTLEALMAHEPIMSGKAGDPALFLERDSAVPYR
jgi:FkbM family methyltransferase